MAYAKLENLSVYYEVHGQGRPLIILNGIMMSTASWQAFVESFSQHHQLILLDLVDQGKSSKMNVAYDQSLQVKAVHAVVEELNLQDIALFGISYGGEVAMHYAIAHPSKVGRLMLFNTTAKTNSWLREIGYAWNRAAENPEAYYSTTIPVIYSAGFFEKNIEWMNRRKEFLMGVFSNQEFIQAMIRLTNSAEHHDVEEKLSKLTMPVLVVGCEHDYITPFEEQKKIGALIQNSELVMIPDSGHASMYEKPRLFTSLVLGFTLADRITFKVN